MSFGFGNNQQQQSTFGGFGSGSTGGFGAGTQASTGGSLFGGQTATSGGFGGFGSTQQQSSSPFGQRPSFGAPATTTSGSSLFGGGTATSGGFGGGGGGFGTTSTSGGFASSTGGGEYSFFHNTSLSAIVVPSSSTRTATFLLVFAGSQQALAFRDHCTPSSFQLAARRIAFGMRSRSGSKPSLNETNTQY